MNGASEPRRARREPRARARKLVIDMPESAEKPIVVRTPLWIYRCIPGGFSKISFDPTTLQVSVGGVVCRFSPDLCTSTVPTVTFDSDIIVRKQACCEALVRESIAAMICQCEGFACCEALVRLARDLAGSFVLAFLVHLVPSIIWGAEVSLGSPSNHQLMGVVWFLGWPVWFVLLQLLRPDGLSLRRRVAAVKFDDNPRPIFVPFGSRAHAEAVKAWWEGWQQNRSDPPPPPPPTRCGWPQAVGLLLLSGLVGDALATGSIVTACIERGCCLDDEATLASCRATGFPNATGV